MCHQCDGRDPPLQPPNDPPPNTLSRRSLLAVGGVFAAGAALGLVLFRHLPANTRPLAKRPLLPPTAPDTPSQTLAVGPEPEFRNPKTENPSPATTLAPNTERAPSPEIENQKSKIKNPPPDLGSELFPDPSGRAVAQASDAPVIIVPRSDWTNAPPNLAQIVPMNGISRITVHHTAGTFVTDAWKPTAADLEGIREFHAGTRPTDRHWADIAYHFAIDRAGRVWQARPLAYQGAHAHGHNEHNLGLVLLGNFEVQSPAAAQLTALAAFLGFLRPIYKIPLDQIFTHGELVDTSCPGKSLQDYMNRTRQAWAAEEGSSWAPTTAPRAAPEPLRTPANPST